MRMFTQAYPQPMKRLWIILLILALASSVILRYFVDKFSSGCEYCGKQR